MAKRGDSQTFKPNDRRNTPDVKSGITRRVALGAMAALPATQAQSAEDASAYRNWLRLPGNAGKSVEEYLTTCTAEVPAIARRVASTLAALKAAPTTDGVLLWNGALFRWDTRSAPYVPDENKPFATTVESDHAPRATGAWVRQDASTIVSKYDAPGAVSRPLSKVNGDLPINLKGFGDLENGADFTRAFLSARALSKRIYLPGGVYCFDAGNGGVGAQISSDTHIFGEGTRTIIRRSDYSKRACFLADSGRADRYIDDISFENLMFDGDVETLGHNEPFGHFLVLDGVRRVRINKAIFRGPRSDAIMFGSGPSGTSERHNFDLSVTDCVFDGVKNGVDGGRNAISVIDGDGVYIAGCVFKNWSRRDMPGSLCFEPDASHGILKNIRIMSNDFRNCAGNRGHISLSAQNIPAENLRNIIIMGNTVQGNVLVSVYTNPRIYGDLPKIPQNIIIDGNTGTDLEFLVRKVKGSLWGLRIVNNHADGMISIGDGTGKYVVSDISIIGNMLSSEAGAVIAVSDNIVGMKLSKNTIRGARQAHVILGATPSSTSYVEIEGNRFIGSSANGMVQHDASLPNPETNAWHNNIGDAGVTHGFRAYRTDFPGATFNLYLETTPPGHFPFGTSTAIWQHMTGPTGDDTGVVETRRLSSGHIEATEQIFIPQYSSGDLGRRYYRRAIDAGRWSAWKTLTGV